MPPITENRVKHLDMIQAIITRMAGESARMKQFGLTTVGILASVSKAADAPSLALVGMALSILFWSLDARYLHQERLFRAHFDEVRNGAGETDFRMTISKDAKSKETLVGAIFGWSSCMLYFALLGICLFLAFGTTPAAAVG